EAAKAFFVEIGMELEGEMTVEGRWVDLVVGLENVRCEIATMRTPDGHGRIELDKFHTPAAVRVEPKNARFCQVVEAEMLIRQAGAPPQSYPPFRRPAPYLSLRPNSRIAAASLDDSRPLTTDAVAVESVG